MATTLPSFVELMASLGLENNKEVADEEIMRRHSRSSSYSSTSSFVSQSSSSAAQADSSLESSPRIVVSSDPPRELEVDRRRHRTRFSPYAPAISHIRRVSLPDAVRAEHQTTRSQSTSPSPGSPSPNYVGRRASTLSLSSGRRPEKLTLDPDFVANTPISTFLRRKTPQSSPISPTFPHRRKRSSSPSLPVIIPSLPTFCFSPQPSLMSGNISSDTDDEIMSDASSGHLDVYRRKPRSKRAPSNAGVNRRMRYPREHELE
ncbi:hypothetical protein BDW22DRAFT_1424868 [Trametopsis cervina]|nr:hypothetical protein BDW22DRAFT_1424868 [Trametopsis cervina]